MEESKVTVKELVTEQLQYENEKVGLLQQPHLFYTREVKPDSIFLRASGLVDDLEDKEFEIIGLTRPPKHRVIRRLGTQLHLTQTTVGVLGSLGDGA